MTLRTDILLAISQVHSGNRDEGGRIADAAILALRQWLADQGLVVVPREATFKMYQETSKHCEGVLKAGEPPNPFRVWSLMIAAAPDALREGE